MWPTISFPQQVGLILTIPAEWPPHNTTVMRECAYKASLLTTLNSTHLEFTTERVRYYNAKFLQNNRLNEITKRVGDLCGFTFVDKEFLHFLERKVGIQALEKLKQCEYGQLNLQQYCPDLQEYVTGEFKEQIEEAGWIIKLDFESVKRMFDPVVDRIIKLIDGRLNDVRERCRAIFLVGEFSKSPNLLSRVKKAFIDQVPIIALPTAAVVRGAIIYGLNVKPTHDLSNEASSVHRIYGMSALR
ncbi:hypothetical protein RhiirA5_507740 [Rhizophagus irregularis]|uniref:Hsp70 family protein n=1 Tax=Rhizophagus irregularis TaxID=588596 RepID=A0A2N0NHM3_9GLOM|nr:hypothetical protein RhiirA5_507740 [Rhizophagus irregularis]